MLIWGDNKLALAALLEQFRGKVDLIYIDPPFDVGADFTMQVQIGDEGDSVEKEQSILEAVAYRDTWGKGTDSYVHMMYERLTLMRDLLSERGSIYVHVGWQVVANVKRVLDEIFGGELFLNEIIWQRTGAHNDSRRYGIIHDTILFYAKSTDYFWDVQYTPYTDEYIQERFRNIEPETGRRFWLNTMTAPSHGRVGKPAIFFGKERRPPANTMWRFTQEKIDELISQNRIATTASGMPYIK